MKVSKQEAEYRGGGTKNHRCHDCTYLELHGDNLATCKKVRGSVKRNDVCKFFERKS